MWGLFQFFPAVRVDVDIIPHRRRALKGEAVRIFGLGSANNSLTVLTLLATLVYRLG
jgi:hypothetical protein